MVAETPEGSRSAVTSPRSAAGSDSLVDHPVLFGLATGGYLVALVGGFIAAWTVPLLVGSQLDWTRQATGLFAWDGRVVGGIFGVAYASFQLLFAACVVTIDLVVIRSLTDSPTPNRRGLGVWSLLAFAGLTVLIGLLHPILPPEGLIPLLSAPLLGVIGMVVVAISGGVFGVAGYSIPVALTRGGVSLAAATRRAVADSRTAPIAVLAASRPVILGWGVGGGLLFVGTGLLGLAFGIPIIGIVLLPIVLTVWLLAPLAFAVGHLRYRFRTVSNAAH